MPPHPVLVIQHEEGCPPGRLVTWAAATRTALDVRRCHDGDPLPTDLQDHGGLIVLSGHMGVYEDSKYPWLPTVKSLVIQAVLQHVPFLGLCLGHQIAGLALGGRVAAHPHGRVRSLQEVAPTPALSDDPIMSVLGPHGLIVQWNADVLADAPGGSVVLSRDQWGQIQIVRFAPRAWGIQGHPEAHAGIVAGWTQDWEVTADVAARDKAREEFIGQIRRHDAEVEARWAPVLRGFFDLTQRNGIWAPGRSSASPPGI